MMNKRILTGTLVAVMALTGLTTGLSFADETTTTEDTKGGRPGVERVKGFREEKGERKEERQENREEKAAQMQAVIDEYYPEVSEQWNDVQDEMKDTMDQIHELKEANRPEKPDFENMTDEEIEAVKEEMKANREERQAEREANREERQAEREANKEEREEKRAAFETALEEGDTDTIKAFIDEALEHMNEKLANSKERLAEMQSAE